MKVVLRYRETTEMRVKRLINPHSAILFCIILKLLSKYTRDYFLIYEMGVLLTYKLFEVLYYMVPSRISTKYISYYYIIIIAITNFFSFSFIFPYFYSLHIVIILSTLTD